MRTARAHLPPWQGREAPAAATSTNADADTDTDTDTDTDADTDTGTDTDTPRVKLKGRGRTSRRGLTPERDESAGNTSAPARWAGAETLRG
ncbi:hypothetical protein ACI1US_01829 [Leucobacter sp. BZR 635]